MIAHDVYVVYCGVFDDSDVAYAFGPLGDAFCGDADEFADFFVLN